ncbi:thermonuclease family protein [Novosphingobium aquiterrae]|uniref:Thermonuclease family protein n=1 Tax=Novosphingobium aquiterrae TaxID=624388 RepID=A0ABV6PJV7_9SPHN
MGDLLPFRRRRKWTRPGDYGQVLPTSQWQGGKRRRDWRRLARTWLPLAAIVAISIWLGVRETAVPAPDASSETVSPAFTVCGKGRATNCVVDGDTIKLGQRSIRIIGIDAPELHPPRCLDEAKKGLEAQSKLLAVLNRGSFSLTGPAGRDEYGRELFNLVRVPPGSSVQSIADEMVASGTVRRYAGGARQPWC